MKRISAMAALCLLAGGGAAAESIGPVKVTGGDIAGVRDAGVLTFLGVPYAAPPVGDLRWRAPRPPSPWQGVRDASHFSPACAQTAPWVDEVKSEDCLYLNIWAPAKANKLPVLVWIHGGGYYGGSGAQGGYDGGNLARRGAVVVTINYRLGIFGFFAHPELPKDSAGNQGMLDQIAALRWVRENIATFGGDAQRVTIMGESAGGESVALLVASPLAKGLFQRAISQSGNDALPLDASENGRFDRKTAEASARAYSRAVGAKNLSALRAMSVEALHKQPWQPRTFVDGHLLHEDLTTTYRKHRQNDVPLLVGWNAEEGKDLAPEILGTTEFNAAKHRALVARLLGHAPSPAILAAYPGATDAQAQSSIDQLTNDWWGWRMAQWAELQTKYGRSKSYVYFFAHRPAEPLTPCGYGCGAGHGAEIQYVFDNLDKDKRPWTATDRQLADKLAATWINFASTGNPGDGWTAYDGNNATIHRIGEIAAPPDFKPLSK